MRSWVRGSVGLLAGAWVATGCASQKPPPEAVDPVAEPCAGQTVLVIRNHLDSDVEVVESRIGSAARTVIALVSPGYREIEVDGGPGVTYSTRRVRGGTVTATSRPRAADGRTVELDVQCRLDESR